MSRPLKRGPLKSAPPKELAEIVNKSGRLVDVGEGRADRPVSRPAASRPAPVRAPIAPLAQTDVAVRSRPVEAPNQSLLQRHLRKSRAVGFPIFLPAPHVRKKKPRSPRCSRPQRRVLRAMWLNRSTRFPSISPVLSTTKLRLSFGTVYRRGERNVFTRRLYTLKGQQTFDDIKRKYQTDGEFRRAVDR